MTAARVFHETSLFSHVSAPLQPVEVPASPCHGHPAQRLRSAMCLLQSTLLWMLQTSYNAVLFSVFVCSLGAMLFGLHLGIVNGPLDAIAADLGFATNPQLKGAVSMRHCTACAPFHHVGVIQTPILALQPTKPQRRARSASLLAQTSDRAFNGTWSRGLGSGSVSLDVRSTVNCLLKTFTAFCSIDGRLSVEWKCPGGIQCLPCAAQDVAVPCPPLPGPPVCHPCCRRVTCVGCRSCRHLLQPAPNVHLPMLQVVSLVLLGATTGQRLHQPLSAGDSLLGYWVVWLANSMQSPPAVLTALSRMQRGPRLLAG